MVVHSKQFIICIEFWISFVIYDSMQLSDLWDSWTNQTRMSDPPLKWCVDAWPHKPITLGVKWPINNWRHHHQQKCLRCHQTKNPTHTHSKPYQTLSCTQPIHRWDSSISNSERAFVGSADILFHENIWWTSNWRSIISWLRQFSIARLSKLLQVNLGKSERRAPISHPSYWMLTFGASILWAYRQKWQPKWHQPTP